MDSRRGSFRGQSPQNSGNSNGSNNNNNNNNNTAGNNSNGGNTNKDERGWLGKWWRKSAVQGTKTTPTSEATHTAGNASPDTSGERPPVRDDFEMIMDSSSPQPSSSPTTRTTTTQNTRSNNPRNNNSNYSYTIDLNTGSSTTSNNNSTSNNTNYSNTNLNNNTNSSTTSYNNSNSNNSMLTEDRRKDEEEYEGILAQEEEPKFNQNSSTSPSQPNTVTLQQNPPQNTNFSSTTNNNNNNNTNSPDVNISQLLDDYNLNFKLGGIDFCCAVCTDILYRPVSTTCGHTFCKACLEEALKHKPHCPICRDTISQLQHFKVNLLIEQILLLNFAKQYKEREAEAFQNLKNKKKIIIGNTHERMTTRTSNQHKWKFYVQIIDDTLGHGGKEVPPSKYIEKLEVFLHPSFTPSHITLTKEPFEVTRLGWGMFNITGKIHFKSHLRLTPLVFNHMLCFQGGKQMAIEIEFPPEK
eukprot:TRINITY_DN304_c0_g1_i1.p1 TRINITY_DN304_c0_g1~~TRINITY_DN304_c0_g1_i1.p1  ORF type:complete len:468 (-),score=107.46 TRINITY_DN304_c0_g1_i1:74-1477(-)